MADEMTDDRVGLETRLRHWGGGFGGFVSACGYSSGGLVGERQGGLFL